MKTRLSRWQQQPVAISLMSTMLALSIYVLGMALNGPWLGVALMAIVSGGLTYGRLRAWQATNHDLRRQLADCTDALNAAQAPIVPLNPLLEAIRAIMFSITDSVIVTDRAGGLVLANPTAQMLIGTRIDDETRCALADWLNKATITAERDYLADLIVTQTPQVGVRVQWTGGRTIAFSLAPIALEGHRRPIGMVVVGRDLTREAELDRLKSRFISTISHELRTPLIGILSQLELLTLGGDQALDALSREVSQRVRVNAQHLLRLITDLLDHAQIETGQLLAVQPIAFAPAQVLEDVEAALLPTAQAKGLTLVFDLQPDLPACLLSDPERLRQILFNLVGNALKFTDQGEVRVSLARPDPAHWLLRVTDTGRGIPLADQPHLFEPFFHTGPKAGAGLGLSIVQHLVNRLDGQITVTSVIDQGATFNVVLPLIEPAPEHGVAFAIKGYQSTRLSTGSQSS